MKLSITKGVGRVRNVRTTSIRKQNLDIFLPRALMDRESAQQLGYVGYGGYGGNGGHSAGVDTDTRLDKLFTN